MRRSSQFVALLVVALWSTSTVLGVDDPCVRENQQFDPAALDTIYVVNNSDGMIEDGEIQGAIDNIAGSCPEQYGTGFPELVLTSDPPAGAVVFNVHWNEGVQKGHPEGEAHAGLFLPRTEMDLGGYPLAHMTGADLTIWSLLSSDNPNIPTNYRDTLSHELMHGLKATHPLKGDKGDCKGRIMGEPKQIFMPYEPRKIEQADCDQADRGFRTGTNDEVYDNEYEDLVPLCDVVGEFCPNRQKPHIYDPVRKICEFLTVRGEVPLSDGVIFSEFDLWVCYDPFLAEAGPPVIPPPVTTVDFGPVVAVDTLSLATPLSGVVDLVGIAYSEESAVARVTIWVDNSFVGDATVGTVGPVSCEDLGVVDTECPTIGYSYSLDTEPLSVGLHTVSILALDQQALPVATRYDFEIEIEEGCSDIEPPVVSFTSPESGAILGEGSTIVALSASDSGGIDNVRLKVNGNWINTDQTAPYEIQWDATPGDHTLEGIAFDLCGNRSSEFITVHVEDAPDIAVFRNWDNIEMTSGSTFEFPDREVNEAVGRFFRIENHGSSTLSISNHSGMVSGTCFSQRPNGGPPDGVVEPGDMDSTFRVRFLCSQHGTYDGEIRIQSDDPDEGEFVINLRATAVPSNDSPIGATLVPNPNQTVSGSNVVVRGWAMDSQGVSSFQIRVDGNPIAPNIPFTREYWPDVCQDHPEIGDPDCPNVGWWATFDSRMFGDGNHLVEIVLTDPLGETTPLEVPVVFSNFPTGGTSTFVAVADAHIKESNPGANFGSWTQMYVRGPGTGAAQYSFAKFSVSGLSANVTSAKLRFRTSAVGPIQWLKTYSVADSTWSEAAITWNNAPFSSAAFLSYDVQLPTQGWYEIDVTDVVTGDGVYSFGLGSDDSFDGGIRTRESSYPPELVIRSHN